VLCGLRAGEAVIAPGAGAGTASRGGGSGGNDTGRPISRARETLTPTALPSLAASADYRSLVEDLCNLDPATLEFAST